MQDVITRTMIDERIESSVLREAAAVADEAVGKAIMTALRAAQVCGCRRCRHEAGRTTLWAVMMDSAGDE